MGDVIARGGALSPTVAATEPPLRLVNHLLVRAAG